MRKHAPTVVLVLAALSLVGAVVVTALRGRGEDSPVGADRPAALRDRLPQARAAAEKAVRDYSPTDPAPITDPATPAAELLRRLPGVAKVEVLVPCARPARRIIHIRDWHAVPKDLYAADLRAAAGRGLTDAEVDARHRELLLQAALVQHDQLSLLRCLARRHGLKRVLAEPARAPAFLLACLPAAWDNQPNSTGRPRRSTRRAAQAATFEGRKRNNCGWCCPHPSDRRDIVHTVPVVATWLPGQFLCRPTNALARPSGISSVTGGASEGLPPGHTTAPHRRP